VVRRAAGAEPDGLADEPDEAALVVGGDEARQWLVHDRHVRLEVDGTVLTAELGIPEGPELGRILRTLLAEKRAGGLPDRGAELARARDLA
jgi:hypothetical protein